MGRHRSQRKPAPTYEERRLWDRFVVVAEETATAYAACRAGQAKRIPDGKSLRGALTKVRRRVMPESQQVQGSPLKRLYDAAGVFVGPGTLVTQRFETAPALLALALEAAEALAQPTRRARADIDG